MATYRDILDQLTTAVAVVDASDDRAFPVTYLNQSGQALFGRSASRAVGAPLDALLRDPHATPSALKAVLESGQPFTKRDVALRLADGPVRASYSISPLSERELLVEFERLDRFIRIDRDKRQAAMQDTMRELGRGLAHEIRNPLGGIRGAAQLLARQLPEAERQYTAIIISETDRLRNLVDRVLAPNGRFHFAPVNVHHVIERVVKLVEAEHAPRIVFKRAYDPSLPEVEGDFEKLVQATLNVLANAATALQDVEQPVIELRTRVVRQFTIGSTRHRLVASMDFIDNGPGIPPHIADRIFVPMISGRASGSGLGLAITQTILAQHNGQVECESEPGRTVFSFFLPLRQPAASIQPNAACIRAARTVQEGGANGS